MECIFCQSSKRSRNTAFAWKSSVPPPPLSSQNGATTNLRLVTICGFLVLDYAGAEVAKYERAIWKIMVRLEKFAKVSESLITFLLKLAKKLLKFCFDFTLHSVSRSQIRPGASDRTQSDNIWLDRVGVWNCMLSHVLHRTTCGLETASDCDRVAECACVQAFTVRYIFVKWRKLSVSFVSSIVMEKTIEQRTAICFCWKPGFNATKTFE